MDIVKASRQRYTAKAYDPTRQVPEETMQQIYEVLRNSPSSVNSQPWHFIVASSPEGKARLAKGVQGGYSFNEGKVRDASHVILFCTRVDAEGGHLDRLLEQEDRDGRYADEAAKAGGAKGRLHFTNLHRYTYKDLPQWYEKQVYIALGQAMLAAAALGVDTTPMEGIDVAALDAELGLHEQGLSSLALLSVGYHAEGDFNARLPKSRLPQEQVFTFL
ncbi:oxygen-insensitive NAD(P)H nitroreductase [Massilia sp. Dwa41.01b]|uniref:oxygen-insensitive NAD(P)H nitroreductase n=1 Tax=unclassified Massilia TaxID=2609279 RepID=UPI0016024BA0|nr:MULTISPECIES: oxygen-insensitive NAD(P)H nitroreductase [unclassified Massilia]QNA89967.1 oxygen-insensitive NAD(P)H nitroreductase [Massilia sp. Dwa41.01b]QNB00850.1 oxygen-insensitive NAD(P)H nitroreductase [Massilia sp. Se16.2.3]